LKKGGEKSEGKKVGEGRVKKPPGAISLNLKSFQEDAKEGEAQPTRSGHVENKKKARGDAGKGKTTGWTSV